MVDSPHIALKVIVFVHFILSIWGSMSPNLFVSGSYIYMNSFVLLFGMWAIIVPDSIDAILMFLLAKCGSIVMDVILIGIFASNGEPQHDLASANVVNTYRFSLGMAIVNLLLKPLSCFVLYCLYQDRRGFASFPSLSIGDYGRVRAGYTNIDQHEPVNSRGGHVETAAPYSTVDKPATPT